MYLHVYKLRYTADSFAESMMGIYNDSCVFISCTKIIIKNVLPLTFCFHHFIPKTSFNTILILHCIT